MFLLISARSQINVCTGTVSKKIKIKKMAFLISQLTFRKTNKLHSHAKELSSIVVRKVEVMFELYNDRSSVTAYFGTHRKQKTNKDIEI